MTWPVIQLELDNNKNFAVSAKSSGLPTLFIACLVGICSASLALSKIGFAIFDCVILGAIQFTLILGANSAARDVVKPWIAHFAVEITECILKPRSTATVENKTIEPLFSASCFCNFFMK